MNDQQYCKKLIEALAVIFPDVVFEGGGEEPFYQAACEGQKAKVIFRETYPRSLLHELAHYCLAGDRRRKLDDFGFWYSPCGRSEHEQRQFETVEARPQGLEKRFCELVGLDFSPSLDDFSGRPASALFLQKLDEAYQEMVDKPPPTAKKALNGLSELGCSLSYA